MNNINLIRSETTKGIHVIKGKALIDDILSYSIFAFVATHSILSRILFEET